MAKVKKEDILNDPDFQKLSGQKDTVSMILTILELVLYFKLVALIPFDKPFLAQKMSEGGSATIGIPSPWGPSYCHGYSPGFYLVGNAKYR